MACSVSLTDSQRGNLMLRLINSDFGGQLYDYYQGQETAPGINLLVRLMNDKMIPGYFGGDYLMQRDLKDFLEDGDNVNAIVSAMSDAMRKIAGSRLNNINHPDYYNNPDTILPALRADLLEKLDKLKEIATQEVEEEESENSSSEGLMDISGRDLFNQRKYKDLQAYREDRFKGSSAIETMFVSRFINDGLVKNVFINTELGKGRGIVSQVQEPGKVSDIDKNLKAYRKSLLEGLLNKLHVERVVNGESKRLTFNEGLLSDENFQDTLNRLEDKVFHVKYKGATPSLDDEGVLTEIVNEYRKNGSEELGSIVDSYIDYVLLNDFDRLFEYYGEGSIKVNNFKSPFDESVPRYLIKDLHSVEAVNAAWKEQIQNGIDFSSDLYKRLIEVTPIMSYVTGSTTREFLYPAIVSEVFSRYYDKFDFEDTISSIKYWIKDGLADPNNSITNKNVLYTMYKKFFEEEGDGVQLHPKNKNTTINSFANALDGVEDKSLMLIATMPIEQTPKVFYAEASDEKGAPAITLANIRANTATRSLIIDEVAEKLNAPMEKLQDVMTSYGVKFRGKTITYTGNGENDTMEYELTSEGAKVYNSAIIKDISRALLGIDFLNNPVDKELWEELKARDLSTDSDDNSSERIVNDYLVFLHDALRIVEAKLDLYNPDIAKEIDDKMLEANPSNEILRGLVKSGKINYNDVKGTIIPLSNANSTNVYSMMYEAENKYTGNQLRKTVSTLEGTTVAGFSTPTYFFTLKNNHSRIRRQLSSVKAYSDNRQVLSNNMFINDESLLERFHVRGATKVGATVKSNSKMNELETLTYNMNLGYFDLINRALKDRTPIRAMFDITTYSDKTTNLLPYVNNDYTPLNGKSIKLFVNAEGTAVGENVTRDLHFQTNGDYYRKHAANIIDDYRKIYEAVGGDALAMFDEQMKGKTKPSDRLKALNLLNSGQGDANKGFWQSAQFGEAKLVGFQALRYYANKAGVTLNNWVHYQNTAKTIDNLEVPILIKPMLIDYVKIYDDPNNMDAYIERMNGHMIGMVKRMQEIGFSLTGPAAEGIAQMYPNMPRQFKTANGYSLVRAGETEIDDVRYINPALRKYFWDFNLISENLMNSSLGPIYSHKGKNEFGMWVTQVKRNVAATASIRKYVLGLSNGVENETKVAVVDDFLTNLKTILSEKEAVVDLDGASLETMTQRIKTWNSLNHRFNGNGGPDHKSFFSHFDSNTGFFHEEKHAAFAMDYSMIRSSLGSDIDLMDLHKKAYATDISNVDITKSWNGTDLSNFKDHFYWERDYDFDNDEAGNIFRLESIQYAGVDARGKSLYNITRRNMTVDPTKSYTVQHPIDTMFDLWRTLGSIDTVSRTDSQTNIRVVDGAETIYFKPSISSAYKLLDYECYVGKEGEQILPADRIRKNRTVDEKAWNTYQQLFATDGLVNSHIDLIRKAYNMDAGNQEHLDEITAELGRHKLSKVLKAAGDLQAIAFIGAAKSNKSNFEKFFGELLAEGGEEGALKFAENGRDYQRFKGENIDRISFSGAVKVGQFNMNDTSTISKKMLSQLNIKPDGTLSNTFSPGERVMYKGKPFLVVANNGGEVGTTQQLETTEGDKSTRVGELGTQSLTLQDLSTGEVVEASSNDVTTTLEPSLPAIPGVTELITNQISNFNGGIQLNAWHEADEATVTAPTQMLNALGFRAFALDDAAEIYDAIGNIVDQGLRAQLADELTGGKRTVDIPQLVSGLSNSEFYAQNKDQLLKLFKALLDESIKETGEFTLENLILKTFDHLNLPVDDTQIFKSAVADLANYFSKSGIRTNFDGIFSVLTPGSGMLQFHDVRGGYLPTKGPRGLEYKKLPTDRATTLNRFDFEQWKKVQAKAAEDANFRLKLPTTEDGQADLNAPRVIDNNPRDLKGQQVVITYPDGTTQDLSILRTGEKHLIPEAEALSEVSSLINKHKGDWEDFKLKFDALVLSSPLVKSSMDSFMNTYMETHPTDNLQGHHILDVVYDELGEAKTYRDMQMRELTKAGETDKVKLKREYDLKARMNIAGKVFLGELQKFLNEASMPGNIPASLKNGLFTPVEGQTLEGAKISISRAEAVAPLTAKTKFLLREGDDINEVDVNFFVNRLNEQLDYYDVDADAVIISNYGKKVFIHNGPKPKATPLAKNVIKAPNGTLWYTDDSGNRLFQIPNGIKVTNEIGGIHMYLDGRYSVEGDNPIIRNLNTAFKSDDHEQFITKGLSSDPQIRAERRAEDQADNLMRAQMMFNSWQKYLTVIGTRIPGQHFQSFQGMKIVGFTDEGNKIYVPNEVTLLSGSDFDIDKQNIIYYSINDDGTLALWHPASKMDTLDNLEKSLQLPMQANRGKDYFVTIRDPEGAPLDLVYDGLPDESDWTNIDNLLEVYGAIKQGFRIDDQKHPQLLEVLLQYEQAPNRGGIKAVKNFAVQKANNIIDYPANFTLLSKQVTIDTPAMFADNSEKAAVAALGRREMATAIVDQKQSNMVGKAVIGIMAAGGLKTYSAMSFAYNNGLKKAERLVQHLERLDARISILEMDPLTNEELLKEFRTQRSIVSGNLEDNVFQRLKVKDSLNQLMGLFYRQNHSIANVNYNNLSPGLIKRYFVSVGYSPGSNKTASAAVAFNSDNNMDFKKYLQYTMTFEEDVAEIISQLLSAATDNAKELILNKINANPDLAGIYSSLLMYGVPFEVIVDLTNSKFMDMLVRKGSVNIFNEDTKENSIKDLVGRLKSVRELANEASSPGAPEALAKRLASSRKMLALRYNIDLVGTDFVDGVTNAKFNMDEVQKVALALGVGDELQILSKALGINQGVKSNTWDLYNFKRSIENYVSKVLTAFEGQPVSFDFKLFLDSLASGGTYHDKIMYDLRSAPAAVNVLHVLTSNPHFTKQLTAYNAANTILDLSSYKVRVTSRIETKLQELGVVRQNSKLTKGQFQEIESYIDNTIIENFIFNELKNNKNKSTQPVFYDGESQIKLDSRENITKFADWVRDKFVPRIMEMDRLRDNEFVQALTPKKKYDKLLKEEPYKFIALKMDTTNVKSIQQQQYRDSYVYGLKQIYDSDMTDGQNSKTPEKNNNIFNVLFWYNLVLNKNNITKNSYAMLLGSVTKLDNKKDNPYGRLLELKGNIGKSDDIPGDQGTLMLNSNGVQFDLLDLLFNYDFGEAKTTGSRRNTDYDTGFADEQDMDQDADVDVDDGDFFEGEGEEEDFSGGDDFFEDYDEEGGARVERIPEAKITRTRTYGKLGTTVEIRLLDRDDLTFKKHIEQPFSLLPHGGENRNKRTYITNYKPLSISQGVVTDTDSINFQKLLNSTVHNFLTSLSSEVSIQIIQKGSDGTPEISIFDPNKEYNCL